MPAAPELSTLPDNLPVSETVEADKIIKGEGIIAYKNCKLNISVRNPSKPEEERDTTPDETPEVEVKALHQPQHEQSEEEDADDEGGDIDERDVSYGELGMRPPPDSDEEADKLRNGEGEVEIIGDAFYFDPPPAEYSGAIPVDFTPEPILPGSLISLPDVEDDLPDYDETADDIAQTPLSLPPSPPPDDLELPNLPNLSSFASADNAYDADSEFTHDQRSHHVQPSTPTEPVLDLHPYDPDHVAAVADVVDSFVEEIAQQLVCEEISDLFDHESRLNGILYTGHDEEGYWELRRPGIRRRPRPFLRRRRPEFNIHPRLHLFLQISHRDRCSPQEPSCRHNPRVKRVEAARTRRHHRHPDSVPPVGLSFLQKAVMRFGTFWRPPVPVQVPKSAPLDIQVTVGKTNCPDKCLWPTDNKLLMSSRISVFSASISTPTPPSFITPNPALPMVAPDLRARNSMASGMAFSMPETMTPALLDQQIAIPTVPAVPQLLPQVFQPAVASTDEIMWSPPSLPSISLPTLFIPRAEPSLADVDERMVLPMDCGSDGSSLATVYISGFSEDIDTVEDNTIEAREVYEGAPQISGDQQVKQPHGNVEAEPLFIPEDFYAELEAELKSLEEDETLAQQRSIILEWCKALGVEDEQNMEQGVGESHWANIEPEAAVCENAASTTMHEVSEDPAEAELSGPFDIDQLDWDTLQEYVEMERTEQPLEDLDAMQLMLVAITIAKIKGRAAFLTPFAAGCDLPVDAASPGAVSTAPSSPMVATPYCPREGLHWEDDGEYSNHLAENTAMSKLK